MKVPLLLKIDIQEITKEAINLACDRNPIGTAPIIFVLHANLYPKRELFVEKCIQVLNERGINPFFPFPCYIQCPDKIKDNRMPQLRSIEEAPKHFIKKIKKVKSREQGLLAKADTYQARIQNQSVSVDLDYIKRKRDENRRLRDACYEKSFYANLLENLRTKFE
jgi:hypothetical protein